MADDAVLKLADSCRKLKELDLSKCRHVGPRGINTLTHSCTRLFSLNLTDCPKITRSFLQQQVSELLFVEWAHAYFGFQPKLNAEELIVVRDRYLLELNAAVAIQKTMRGCLAASLALGPPRVSDLFVDHCLSYLDHTGLPRCFAFCS